MGESGLFYFISLFDGAFLELYLYVYDCVVRTIDVMPMLYFIHFGIKTE